MLSYIRKHPEVLIWGLTFMLVASMVLYDSVQEYRDEQEILSRIVEECAEFHGAGYLGCKQQVTDRIRNKRNDEEGFFHAYD